jgi:hypothetical protein
MQTPFSIAGSLIGQLTSAAKPFQHDENKRGTRPVDREGPRQRAVAIRTLGDLGEQSQLYAYCDACRHSAQLDLAALRERCGPQLSLARTAVRARRRRSMLGTPARTPELSLGFLERLPCAHQLGRDQVHLAQLRLGIELTLQLGDPSGTSMRHLLWTWPIGRDRGAQQEGRKIVAELRLYRPGCRQRYALASAASAGPRDRDR